MSRARDTADQINRINSSAADATAITVDSSENVGIGTDSSYPLTVQSGTAGSNHAIALRNSSNNFSRLGFLQTDSATAAYSSIDGDGRASGYLKFNTNDTERLRIDSDGLKFHGDTAAANALNDYEQGIHTSTASSSSGTPTIASGEDSLSYVKIGNVVHINGQLGTVSCSGCSGDLFVTMPFTNVSLNERADYAFMTVPKGDTGAGVSHFYIQNTGGGTSFQVVAVMANGTQDGSVATLMANEGNFDLNISGTYRTA